MIRESEVINLILGVASIPFLLFGLRGRRIPGLRMMFAGFFLIVCAYIFTVVEGFYLYRFFNLLENLLLALAGLLFAAGCRALRNAGAHEQDMSP
jgi:hypothetical protein